MFHEDRQLLERARDYLFIRRPFGLDDFGDLAGQIFGFETVVFVVLDAGEAAGVGWVGLRHFGSGDALALSGEVGGEIARLNHGHTDACSAQLEPQGFAVAFDGVFAG